MEALRNVAATLRVPEYGDDATALSGNVTVTITRQSDGSKVVTEGAATEVAGDPAHWTYTVPGRELATLDVLTAEWTDGASIYTTICEIVGGFIVSLDEVTNKLDEPAGHEPDVLEVAQAREEALGDLERACNVYFRPRFVSERLTGNGERALALGTREPRRILHLTVNGVAMSAEEIAALELDPYGSVVKPTGAWTSGATVAISYEAGYVNYPDARRHVRDLAAYYLTPSPTDWMDRATSYSNDGMTYSLVTPGMRGAMFPLPSVNAFVESFYRPLVA